MGAYKQGGGGGRAIDITDNNQFAFDLPWEIGSTFNAQTAQQINEMFRLLFRSVRDSEDAITVLEEEEEIVSGALKTVSVTLTHTQIQTLNTAPVTLLSAPDSGFRAIPVNWTLEQSMGGTTFSASPVLRCRYTGDTIQVLANLTVVNLANTTKTSFGDMVGNPVNLTNDFNPSAKALEIYSTAALTDGSGSFKVTMAYYLVSAI